MPIGQGYVFPSGTNTFVPSFDATGQLTVEFSRNPKDFALNRYVTITPVKKSSGFYMQINPEQAARVMDPTNLGEFVWHDGTDAPDGNWGTEAFQWQTYNTLRYAFPFSLGYKAEKQADWRILAVHAAIAAQDAMTARTVKVQGLLTTPGSWPTNHTSTFKNVGTLQSGSAFTVFANGGSSTNPVILNALNLIAQQIQLDTLGRVKMEDLILVIPPKVATGLAVSQEIHDYMKSSVYSLPAIKGENNINAAWNLPDHLYGMEIVVEDAVRVSNRKGAALSTLYTMYDSVTNKDMALVLARKGGLVSPAAGGPSFSTVHLLMYEEMTVESRDDVDNRKVKGRVVEDYDVQLVAPITGYLITNMFS